MQCDGIVPRVCTEHFDPAGRGFDEPEQNAKRRRLSCAVRTEEAVYLTCLDGQVQSVEGGDLAELFRQSPDLYGAHIVSRWWR